MSGFCLQCDVPRPCRCFDGASRLSATVGTITAFLDKGGFEPFCEVHPNLFLGDLRAALPPLRDRFDVVISALDDKELFEVVKPDLAIEMDDAESQNVGPAVEQVCEYLRNVKDGRRILIHCLEGRSRSVALMAGYLILERKMSLSAAMTKIRDVRPRIRPQESFLKQLADIQQQRM